MPIMASPKGSAVPVSTELMTMQNKEAEMATESIKLPSVMYTRANPATAFIKMAIDVAHRHGKNHESPSGPGLIWRDACLILSTEDSVEVPL